MEQTTPHSISRAALAILIILQAIMLGALFTQTIPHPPLTIPLFALGPFLGASISIATAAWILGACSTSEGRAMTVLAAVLALISFGPQKWIDPAIGQIWPAVLLAELAIVVIAVSVYKRW